MAQDRVPIFFPLAVLVAVPGMGGTLTSPTTVSFKPVTQADAASSRKALVAAVASETVRDVVRNAPCRVIGYGLDFDGKYRNLPHVAVVDEV